MRTMTRIKTTAVKRIPILARIQRTLYRWKPYRMKFRAFYLDQGWGHGRESRSGPGSSLESTEAIRAEFPPLFAALRIESILDVPCGDFNWMRQVDLGHLRYVGIDIVPELVRANTAAYGRPGVEFRCGDLLTGRLPRADLVLCRDCLVHYRNRDVLAALRQIRASGATFLLTTTYPDLDQNVDLSAVGLFRRINLERAPFNWPVPMRLIRENSPDRRLGLWDLRQLPPER